MPSSHNSDIVCLLDRIELFLAKHPFMLVWKRVNDREYFRDINFLSIIAGKRLLRIRLLMFSFGVWNVVLG